MAKNRLTIDSNFPAVKKAGGETVQASRETWLAVGKDTAEAKANDTAATRGYALQVGVEGERIGHQSARIFPATHSDQWGDDPWFLAILRVRDRPHPRHAVHAARLEES